VSGQSQNLIRFPAVKRVLILEQNAEKSTYLNLIELDVRKPVVVFILLQKSRAVTSQPGSEFDNFKPRFLKK
jgi:hypothetical protein